MNKLIALLMQVFGATLFYTSMFTDIWFRGCTSETYEGGVIFVFGSACADKAAGLQAIALIGGVIIFALGWMLHEHAAKKA